MKRLKIFLWLKFKAIMLGVTGALAWYFITYRVARWWVLKTSHHLVWSYELPYLIFAVQVFITCIAILVIIYAILVIIYGYFLTNLLLSWVEDDWEEAGKLAEREGE